MAITIIQPINVASIAGGFDFAIQPYTDASGATYKVGSPLSPSGGDLVEATDADPVVNIAGFAMQAGSNITGTHVANSVSSVGVVTPLLVALALPTVIFEGTFANEGADVAIAATDLYVKYGLGKDSTTGYWYVDKGDTTTNASVLVIGIKNQQDLVLGTTKGARVYFIVLQDATTFTTQA